MPLNRCYWDNFLPFHPAQGSQLHSSEYTCKVVKVTVMSFLSMNDEIEIKGCPPETGNESISSAIIPHWVKLQQGFQG